MNIAEESWDSAVAAIQSTQTISLGCHIGPDGDALGSMLGVGLGLTTIGKSVKGSWGQEPFAIPSPFDRIVYGKELLVPPRELPKAPVFIAFDTASLERLGQLADRATDPEATTIVLDHHRTNDGFAQIDLVDPDAAATAVLGRELLRRLDVKLTKEIATCFYIALVTDTGRFQYRNTTPSVHELAGELLAAGVEQDRISQELYQTRTLAAMRATGIVLSNVRIVEDASLVWSSISLEEAKQAGANRDDLDGLIDDIRVLDTCEAALLLKQAPDGGWRGSLRSKDKIDVSAVAAAFGGGGHTLAAGFTAPDELKDPEAIANSVIEKVRAQR
jgi:bifunctional oligoribonuclease and PAP phosphatase NrnA